MTKNFLSINSNYTDFISLKSPEVNNFILENQESVLSKVYGFFQKNDSLLCITGFLGTGKTQLVKHLLNYIDKSVLLLNVDCSKSLSLDDLLLILWSKFVSNGSNVEIAYKYRHINLFQDKLVNCLSEFPHNIVITLFDFDLVEEENSLDILNFIWSISEFSKVKIIISSKTFDTSLIPEKILYTKVILKAFTRIIFEKFLQEKDIKATPRILDELYKITRGYYFYTEVTANILLKKELSVSDYLVAYTNSAMSFDKFLAKAFISMLEPNSYKLLTLLSLIRHPINSQILDYFEMFDRVAINDLVQNGFMRFSGENYVLKDYFKKSLLDDLDKETELVYRKLIIKFYNSQLPLKPTDRFVMISRSTMRNEINYHSNIISPQIENETIDNKIDFDNLSSTEKLNLADSYIEDYKYNEAIKIYLNLLEKDEELYKNDIYYKLANVYEKIGNLKYSLHYYNLLKKCYEQLNDFVSLQNINILIAKVYYQSYKSEEAISILNSVITETIDNNIIIAAYTLLGNIYISLSLRDKAYEVYNKAIVLAEQNSELENLSELYFKFALLADENNEPSIAIHYYKKCIESADDNNKYKSLSYSNLGDFYLDYKEDKLALLNFEKALELDTKNSNNYGIYYAASNIAKLLLKLNCETAFSYLEKAKSAATKSDDLFAMANSGLHLGDFYSNNKEYEKALKEYFSVLNLVKDKFSKENTQKILIRIDDLKYKIGETEFNELSKYRN